MSRAKYDKVNDRLILIAGKEDTSVPTFTMAEWEAMTDAQKAEYDGKLFVISDDFNGMTVDDELSDTSIHPVQNKVITEEINDISDEISDMNNILGAKNLLPNNATTQTVNGITFTVNSDGSVTANGTATAQARLFIVNTTTRQTYLDEGINYILSGCPNNSGSNQYFLRVSGLVGESWVSSIDYGSGVEIQSSIITASRFQVFIEISNGATVSNLVFKPMIRPASIKDDTYVPYAMTNRELTENVSSNYLGARVNITSYTSSYYAFPSDGYLALQATAHTNTIIIAEVRGANNSGSNLFGISANHSQGNTYNAIFVRKGMMAAITQNVAEGLAMFIPFN